MATRGTAAGGLPDFAALGGGANHGRAASAAEGLSEGREIRQRADHAKFRDRVRVTLDHETLGLRADLVAAELAPGDEELLIGSEAVDRRRRVLLARLLEGEIGHLHPGQIGDALAEHEFPIVMDVGLDEIAIELPRHARSALLELTQIFRAPPVGKPSLRIELRALIVETVADLVPDHDTDAAVVH